MSSYERCGAFETAPPFAVCILENDHKGDHIMCRIMEAPAPKYTEEELLEGLKDEDILLIHRTLVQQAVSEERERCAKRIEGNKRSVRLLRLAPYKE